MKKNMHPNDRIFRIAFAAIVAVLFFTNTISGVFGTTLLVAGAILLLTAFINFCPIYYALGIKKWTDKN